MPNRGACKTQGSGSDEIWMLGLALRTSSLTHYAPLLRNASINTVAGWLVAIWGQPGIISYSTESGTSAMDGCVIKPVRLQRTFASKSRISQRNIST